MTPQRRLISVIVTLAMLFACATSRRLSQANELIAAGQYERALEIGLALLRKDKSVEVQQVVATSANAINERHLAKAQQLAAASDFEGALREHQAVNALLDRVSQAGMKVDRYTEEEESLRSQAADCYVELARQNSQQPRNALDLFEKAAAFTPDRDDVRGGLADSHLKVGIDLRKTDQFVDAAQHFEQALQAVKD